MKVISSTNFFKSSDSQNYKLFRVRNENKSTQWEIKLRIIPGRPHPKPIRRTVDTSQDCQWLARARVDEGLGLSLAGHRSPDCYTQSRVKYTEFALALDGRCLDGVDSLF